MTIQVSVEVRNARLDAFETAAGATVKLQIRTGAQPANTAAAASGTLLAELTLPSDWMAAASAGSKGLTGSWAGAGAAAGTAAHFQIMNNAGSLCHMQGSVSATGGGGDMTLDNTSIAVSQAVNITSFTLNEPGA